MHSFTYDGINSRDYCELFVSGGGTFNAPERDIESISIQGRNGELTVDKNRYKNITVSYEAWIAKNFKVNAMKARNWLCAKPGYRRLEDDYHTDEYRMARFIGGINFETWASNGDIPVGDVTLEFDCMPQRWLKSGEQMIHLTASGPIINPTAMASKPLITVYGSGSTCTLTIGSASYTITNLNSDLTLDSEIELAYKGTLATLSPNSVTKYPEIAPGLNTISWSGGITAVDITPRWWRL